MKKIYYIILGILMISIDQIIKVLMINVNIDLITNYVSLSYTENTKAAFSLGSYYIVTTTSFAIIVLLFCIIIKYRNKITNFTPIILIMSGGISNLIDRLFRGFVVDYISVINFPVFNIADILIVIGTAFFIVKIMMTYSATKR